MATLFFLAAYGYELIGNDFFGMWNRSVGICCWLFGAMEIHKKYRAIKKVYEESKRK